MRLLGSGSTSEVYELGDNRILKLYFPGAVEKMRHEMEVYRYLAQARLPVFSLEGTMEHSGRDGLVFGRSVIGPTIRQVLLRSPWRAAEMGRLLARLHLRVHEEMAPMLPAFSKVINKFSRGRDKLSLDQVNKLEARLNALPAGDTLCHGDFHLSNVILHKNEGWIIDWARAGKGSPMCDLAKSFLTYKPTKKVPWLRRSLQLPLRLLVRETYLNSYLKAANFNFSDFKNFIEPLEADYLLKYWSLHRDEIDRKINLL